MKKRTLAALASAAIFTFAFTACGGQETSSEAPAAKQETQTTVPQATAAPEQTADAAAPASTQAVPTGTSAQAAVTPQASPAAQTSAETEITGDAAKQIAFEHAQVQESDAVLVKVKKDFEDGIFVYDVDFYVGNQEYEYEIHALTGQILEFDYDIDNDFIDPSTVQTAFSAADAKAAALAKVPGAGDSNIRLKLEYDDGILLYEGEIVYGDWEYEFEIDANSGTFYQWEQESILR